MTSVTQERILASATECFGRFGYKKTSIDAIAERAGVAKGTVYLYCENKQELFYQSLHRELRDWVASLSKKIDPRRPADELMLEIAGSDVAFLEQRPLVRDLLFGLYHGLLPDAAPQLEELRVLGLRHVVEILELGIRQGIFAAELDVPATARVLQDMQLSGSLLGRRTRLPESEVRRQRHAAVRLVLDGLRAR